MPWEYHIMLQQGLNRLTGFVTGTSGPANEIITEINDLQGMYRGRQESFNRWYSLLSMVDELKQENMESFVGNDPRTTWNMAVFLLQPKPLNIKITMNTGTVTPNEVRPYVDLIQQYFNTLWDKINNDNQKRGKETWFWNFIGFLVSTGWYCVPYAMDTNGVVSVDYWNPAHIFPEWSSNPSEGLLRLARKRSVSSAQAMESISKNPGWELPAGRRLSGKVVEGHLWKRLPTGIAHAVVMDNMIIKMPTIIEGIDTIPILAGSVAGIPSFDDKDRDLSGTMGQSVLATNEPIYRAFNKLQSFNFQLIRDTANPRVFERSVGQPIISGPQEWYKRGAMFRGSPQDSIEMIQMPGIPVELSQALFTLRNQEQRGGFSDVTFGSVLGEISSTIITQAAEAALQLISPFHNAAQHVASEVTDSWYHTYLNNPNLRPEAWGEIPDEVIEILKDTCIYASYAIKIPGDLSSRIAMSKQLNSRFELPTSMIMDLLLPEVTNVNEALALLDAEKAKLHPSYSTVQLIQAFEAAAQQARAADNVDQAGLFESLAQQLTKSITGQPTVADRLGTNSNGAEAPDVIPSQSMAEARLGVGGGRNGASPV